AFSTEIADLGSQRFDHDVAAGGDRDTSLYYKPGSITVASGRVPRGKEAEVFAWKAMQYTDEDQNAKEELKGDLHGGQLHRQNRAANMVENPEVFGQMRSGERERGGRGGRGGGGRGGRGGRSLDDREDGITAAIKPAKEAPPLAKGFAKELDKGLFWDGPIV
ncbi:hypothetical protein K504DRAFT_340495, partial [Pleomassaria siparia CBS 279.74]